MTFALIRERISRIYAETVTESGNTAAGSVCQTNSLFLEKSANGKIVVFHYRQLENPDKRGFWILIRQQNEQKAGLDLRQEQTSAYDDIAKRRYVLAGLPEMPLCVKYTAPCARQYRRLITSLFTGQNIQETGRGSDREWTGQLRAVLRTLGAGI